MAKLHIVRASAGSGKTFRLTLQYLSQLFDNTDNFKHILAVTFTNKAIEEMKSRIIQVLFELATEKETVYLKELEKTTDLKEKSIRLKADIILKKILHNYSRFSVETIDSFFQQLIRSFTREIGIQSGYSIELDDELVLGKAIDDIFIRIEHDKSLREWIVKFTETKIESSKSWNLKNEIFNLGKEVFKEGFKQFGDNMSQKLQDKAFLSKYLGELHKIIHRFENTLIKLGKQAIEHLKDNGLEIDDFYQKNRGPAGYFYKLSTGTITEPNSYVKAALESTENWGKHDSNKWPVIKQACEKALFSLLHEIVDYYNQNLKNYKTAIVISENFYTLGILTDIKQSIYKYTREKNLFMISDSAHFINNIIQNNDTPFIFEKAGNYFHHFLIDEFQDTSVFQWKNFKPLISNSLSQNFDCLVVGDVKQSIYRWRNSNWEILSNEVLNDFYSEAINLETLDINRRSKQNLVAFNNSLFTLVPEMLEEQFNHEIRTGSNHEKELSNIKDLYTDVIQNLPEKVPEGGYVSIRFIKNTDQKKEYIFNELVEIIKRLQDKGYAPGNIAILTRGRKEGKEIADFLLQYKQNQQPVSTYKFGVVSDESLMLGSSIAVRFIISILTSIVDPENNINNYYIWYEYLNYVKKTSITDTAIIPGYNPSVPLESMKSELPGDFFKLLENHKNLSLYEMIQEIIQIFELHLIEGELAFLHAFKDLVLEYMKQYNSAIPAFLEYWIETGASRSISGADNQDAIRILTIHKSKGLEFRAVIIPFCDWKIDKPGSIIWCYPGESPFNQIEILPVAYKSVLGETIFANDYYTEKIKTYIDNINLLYVAFTRAKDALFCFSGINEKTTDSITDISQLLYSAFNESCSEKNITEDNILLNKFYNAEKRFFELGQLTEIQSEKIKNETPVNIRSFPENDTLKRMRIAYQGKDFLEAGDSEFHPLNYGKIMHELFSAIYNTNDITPALESLFYQGKIDENEKKILHKEINSLFTDIQVQSWFSGEWKVLNERDILLKNNESKRPDRILIKDDNAILIDYKFGNKELNDHKNQVTEYAKLIRGMGFKQVESYLWYISKRKIVQVIS